jgi:hypothetical protein
MVHYKRYKPQGKTITVYVKKIPVQWTDDILLKTERQYDLNHLNSRPKPHRPVPTYSDRSKVGFKYHRITFRIEKPLFERLISGGWWRTTHVHFGGTTRVYFGARVIYLLKKWLEKPYKLPNIRKKNSLKNPVRLRMKIPKELHDTLYQHAKNMQVSVVRLIKEILTEHLQTQL